MHRKFVSLALVAIAFIATPERAIATVGDGFDVVRYVVSFRPDLSSAAVSGHQTIIVRGTSDGVTQLAFTSNALRIDQATVDGAPIPVSSSKDAIVFRLPKALQRGQKVALRFRIEGQPARGVKAVAGVMYTSYFACDWMVCLQDTPGDKAHLALDLIVPAGVASAGVGRATIARASGKGLVVHRWRSTRPYSPYLYAFAVGRFARHSVRTPHGDLVYLDGTGTNANLPALFAQTPAMVAFFGEKAGVPLPDRQYLQLLVPGREAQESASFSLIGADELDRERADPTSAWVVAHELAHQWWGNLVTCATWQHFWLNEGVATFMVAAWKEHSIGRAAYDKDIEAARRRVDRVREHGFDKPLTWSGSYPSLSARRAVQYSKGALFLNQLRTEIGDAAFWKGLRRYTRDHAGGTVTSQDFQAAMQQSSGRDLSAIFNRWVYAE